MEAMSMRPAGGSRQQGVDSHVLLSMRQHVDALEERLSIQFNRLQQETTKLWETTLASKPEDRRAGGREAMHPRVERRLAELSGHCTGLSEELQSQIRRTDQLNERFWEWRRQMDEDLRSRFAELGQSLAKNVMGGRGQSSIMDETLKHHGQRLQRLELELSSQPPPMQDLEAAVIQLHQRCETLEVEALKAPRVDTQPRELAPTAEERDATSATLVIMQQRFSDVCEQVDRCVQDVDEVRSGMESLEERVRTLRTKFDVMEDQRRKSIEDSPERGTWEKSMVELRSAMEGSWSSAWVEKIEMMNHRLELLEQAYHLAPSPMVSRFDPLLLDASHVDGHGASFGALQDCYHRLTEVAFSEKSQAPLLSVDAELSPDLSAHLHGLLEQLKVITPKVMEHEDVLRKLQQQRPSSETSAAETATAAAHSHYLQAAKDNKEAMMADMQAALGSLRQELKSELAEIRQLTMSESKPQQEPHPNIMDLIASVRDTLVQHDGAIAALQDRLKMKDDGGWLGVEHRLREDLQAMIADALARKAPQDIAGESAALAMEQEVSANVSLLVQQLQEIMPRVLEHGQAIEELRGRDLASAGGAGAGALDEPPLSRYELESIIHRSVLSAKETLEKELDRLRNCVNAAAAIIGDRAGAEEKQLVSRIDGLLDRVGSSMDAVEQAANGGPALAMPPMLVQQMETLMQNVQKSETQNTELQVSLHRGIDDLHGAIPYILDTVEELKSASGDTAK